MSAKALRTKYSRMKIGIITLPLETNYGGLLQNYALQQILHKCGHEAYTIDCKFPKNAYTSNKPYKYLLFRIRQIKRRLLGRAYCPNRSIRLKIIENCEGFIQENILLTPPAINHKEYVEILKKYNFDALVVGSDQVWRPQYSPNITNGFLDFIKDEKAIKRLTYAASFGEDNWEFSEKQTNECSHLAKLFDAISVREESGVMLAKKYLGVNAEHVLDPTMLLEQENYINLVERKEEKKSPGNLFCYILDKNESINRFIQDVEQKLLLKSFQVKAQNNTGMLRKGYDIKDYIVPSPTKWLRAFMDAKVVLTDSFHGCVFSIIFNKEFWVTGNKGRGNARFDSLLKQFGLENRRIDIDKINDVDFAEPIDWERVNSIKKEWQEKSINFLKENL